MSKPGRQSKSGAPSKPVARPQRRAPAPVGPPPRTVARLWPYLKAGLAMAVTVYLLIILAQTGPVDELLIRIGWKDAPSTIEPQ